MAKQLYIDGLGGTTGDQLATLRPLYLSGDVWYVHGSTGTDAASPAGRDRGKPLATTAQAVTNAAAGDFLCFLSGHAENISTAIALSKQLFLVGEGQFGSSSMPTFTRTAAGIAIFNVTAAGCHIRGVRMAASTASTATERVTAAAANLVLQGVYCDAGANDIGPAVKYTGASLEDMQIRSCTFISTATSAASQPHSAISVASAVSDLYIDGLVLDGGSSGWSNQYALDMSAAVTRLCGENITLRGGSDVSIGSGSTTGYFHVVSAAGGGRVVWT